MKKIITTILSIVISMTTFAQKGGPLLGTVTLTQPTCYGYSNGEITVVTTGGMAPYNYLWSTGDTTETISNLSAGNYSVLVTDVMGNTMGSFFTINQPAQITVSGTVTNTPFGTSNGSINVSSINNAVGNYNYVWSSNNGQVMTQGTLNQTGLMSGGYKIYITDENGCEGVGYFNVNSVLNPVINPSFKIKPSINNTTAINTYPNPSNGNFTIESKDEVVVKIIDIKTGVEVFQSIDNQKKININGLMTGEYMILYTIGSETKTERVSVL